MTSQNLDYILTKDLFGAAGPENALSASPDGTYSLAYAWGEPVSGNVTTNVNGDMIISGYFGGRFGNGQTFQLLTSQVGTPGTKTFFQDQLQVGVHFDAPISLAFSDQVNQQSINFGIEIFLAADHLGHSSTISVPFTTTVDATGRTVTLTPNAPWLGNTLYDVQLHPALASTSEFQLDQEYHVYFITMLDHHQENIVLNPIIPSSASGFAAGATPVGPMAIDIPLESLADYSTVLLSRNPLSAPLRADPKIIQEANDKARAAGNLYRVPVSIQEITAFDTNGNVMKSPSKPVQVTIDYGTGFNAQQSGTTLIRPQTLSLWVLDEEHRLWVKIPATQNAVGFHTVSAPVTAFSVYALMGSADGSATDSYAFPVPWRPHGPNAGTGAGQTGTEADGIIFSNLPSECTINIYTISGDLVRKIQHSDTGGLIAQQKWDVKTSGGDPVASGVYLWRVESSVDGKNGKLMVIR